MPGKKHIVFVMSHMRMGGAERFVSFLLAQLADDYRLTLINLSEPERDYFEISETVTHQHLHLDRPARHVLDSLWNVTRRVFVLRGAIRAAQPDLMLSFTDRTNVLMLLAVVGMPISSIVSVRTHPLDNGMALKTLCRVLYPRSSAVTFVSDGTASAYSYLAPAQKYIIYNAVRDMSLKSSVEAPLDPQFKHLLSVGRLIPLKRHQQLIDIFAQLAPEMTEWHFSIIGDGDLRSQLQQRIAQHQLENRVHLLGRQQNVEDYLAAGDLYVQASTREGFSNAVLEAMAAGLPVIVTDYLGDPRAVIESGLNGVIVPRHDFEALREAMRDLMSSPEKRDQLGKNALKVRETFHQTRIVDQWRALIDRYAR